MAIPLPPLSDASPEFVLQDKQNRPFMVREYRDSDRNELQRFYEAFEPKRTAQGLPPVGSRRIGNWLSSILTRGVHLIACVDGELIGHALVVPSERPGIGEYAIFLREDMRDRGIGTAMNRTMLDMARREGIGGLWLTVEPHNRAAIRSYEKVGFRFIPETVFSTEPEMELAL